jgi:pimeloyl-ACP methyl ester carboxylesterase
MPDGASVLYDQTMLDRLADLFVRRMLRPPRRVARPLPAALAARAADVTIPASRVPLSGWLVGADREAVGTVVVVHGWGGDAGRMAPLAEHLLVQGMAVLLVDLPGHGRTGAVPTYNAKLMVDDLRSVRDWVAGRDDLRVRPAAILGFSFGGLGAYVAASRDPRWAALVVLAAPLGPMEAVRLYLDGRGLPGRLLDGTVRRSFVRAVGADPDAFGAAQSLVSIRVPVLVVHGQEDEVVPVWHADRIGAAVPPGLGTLWRVPEADHSAVLVDDRVGERVAAFLSTHLARVGDRS